MEGKKKEIYWKEEKKRSEHSREEPHIHLKPVVVSRPLSGGRSRSTESPPQSNLRSFLSPFLRYSFTLYSILSLFYPVSFLPLKVVSFPSPSNVEKKENLDSSSKRQRAFSLQVSPNLSSDHHNNNYTTGFMLW